VHNWIHQLLNPHCEHCQAEKLRLEELARENKVCDSCQTLTRQLEIANNLNEKLMDRLTAPPVVQEHVPLQGKDMQTVRPRAIPWNIRKQMLEAEDRKKADLLRQAPKPIESVPASTEQLERELGVDLSDEKERVNV
jgi:hypothetical protein